MKKRVLVLPAVLCAGLAFATPGAAADHDHEGWYLEVEAASSTPGNVNTPVLTSTPADGALSGGSGPFENSILSTDFDSDVDYRIGFGYGWGRSGRLQVTYWSYSDKETVSSFSPSYYATGGNQYNWFNIGPTAAWGYSFYGDVTTDMTQEIEASTIDVEYLRPVTLKDEKLTLTWGIGLRVASFEDKVRGSYLIEGAYYPGAYRFPVTREVDSDGFGVTGSVGAEYMFGGSDRVGISSRLRVGFLVADIDGSQSAIDLDGYYSSAGANWSESVTREDETATTLDYEANIVIKVSDPVSIDLGWSYSSWSDLAQVPLSRAVAFTEDQAGALVLDENRDRISWSGPRLRIRFRFGGGG